MFEDGWLCLTVLLKQTLVWFRLVGLSNSTLVEPLFQAQDLVVLGLQ